MRSPLSLTPALLACALLLAPLAPASAAIFKCKAANGATQFSDRPCGAPENQEEIAHESPVPAAAPSNAEQTDKGTLPQDDTQASYAAAEQATPPLLTLADLQGTWSDLDFDSPLRGYWVFSSTTLRMDRKGMEVRNRVQATLRFTLKGNLLTLTHEPDAFSKKRWDEKLVIERYEPGRLIDLGSLVLHRVR
ncbi:DUF4124 domain-containing protein [Pseudomonas solani]|uniref:DUF4124 domain-containing protein n=1 Tax=Pseudomonas solani TaxID=2731552 RepID=UPI003C2D55B4